MKCRLGCLLILLVAATPVPAQEVAPPEQALVPSAPATAEAGRGLPPVPDLESRLEALHPSEPLSYFRLAEEVASEATHADHQRLARTLYILSMVLQPNPAAAEITPSVCLGLADLAITPDEKRWLEAMADSLTRRDRLEPAWSPPGPEASPEQASLDLATAIGLIRAGEGSRARPLFEQPAVTALLRKLEFTLRDSGMSISELQRSMDLWRHCPQCFDRGLNQRVINRPNGFILCPTCSGNPGPVLTRDQLIGQLRFESLLLDGVNRSWSAQALVDHGAPLRALDPGELPGTFGVDPARSFWRNGVWVTDPAAPPPSETPTETTPERSPDPTDPAGTDTDDPAPSETGEPPQEPAPIPPANPDEPIPSEPAPGRGG